jgi:hypothetical protein
MKIESFFLNTLGSRTLKKDNSPTQVPQHIEDHIENERIRKTGSNQNLERNITSAADVDPAIPIQ